MQHDLVPQKLHELQSNPAEDDDDYEDKLVLAQNDVHDAQGILDSALAEKQRIFEADEVRKQKTMQSTKVQNWVKVNQRAREKNRTADYLSYKEHAKQAHSSSTFDPFARRKVKPDILWEVGQGKDKDADKMGEAEKGVVESESKSDQAKNKVSATTDSTAATSAAKNGEKENKKKIDFLSSQKELLGKKHQFAIDEEVLARTSRLNVTDNNGGSNFRQERVRRGLSLSEYLQRKAAGTL